MNINLDLLYQYSNQNPYAEEYISNVMWKEPWVKYYKREINTLFYLWFYHIVDINDQLPILRSEFETFAKSSNKRICFIEAKIQMKPGTTFPSEEKAIKVFESWLTHYLSVKKWIECICIQPTHEEEIENLRSHGIWEEIILLYEFWRSVYRSHQVWWVDETIKQTNSWRQRTKQYFKQIDESLEWIDVFRNVYKSIHKENLVSRRETNRASIQSSFALSPENTVATIINQYTEVKMLLLINQYIEDDYDIFCVYGAWHLLRQEKVFDDMFKVNTIWL